MDGGSTDGTIGIIKKYEKYFAHWESHKDSGQASAIKKGFRLSSGEILAYLNSDDVLFKDALFYIADAFSQNPCTEMIIGNSIEIDEYDQVLNLPWIMAPDYYSMLFWSAAAFSQAACFWRRKSYFKVGEIDETYKFCMDYDLFIRLAKKKKPKRLHKYLAAVRFHANRKTQTLLNVSAQEQNIIHNVYQRDRYGKLVAKVAETYYKNLVINMNRINKYLHSFHLLPSKEWKAWWDQ